MVYELLFLASGLNIIVLAIFILYRKRIPVPLASKYFTLMLFLMVLYCLMDLSHYFIVEHRIYSLLRYYFPLEGVVFSLITPVFYLFLKAILQQPIRFRFWKVFFFVLPTTILLIYSSLIMFLPASLRVEVLISYYKIISTEFVLINTVFYTQIIITFILCLKLLNDHYRTSQYIIVNRLRYEISWLRSYAYLNLIYIILSIPFYFYFRTQFARIIITQIGIEIPVIYLFTQFLLNTDGEFFKLKLKKSNRPVNLELSSNQLNTISDYMHIHKPFLSDKCTIQTVAEQTGIPVHQISTALNCVLNKSFTDYINELRVEEAKKILLTPRTTLTTIEAISMDCGFGSKSNFNKMFKKFTLVTPREFMNSNRKDLNNLQKTEI